MRLAHRVKELHELPHDLANVPSIIKVKNWYAQSFEDLVSFPAPRLSESIQRKLARAPVDVPVEALQASPNPSLEDNTLLDDGTSKKHLTVNSQRDSALQTLKRWPVLNYGFSTRLDDIDWPQELMEYNENFTRCLERIKHRHDAVVTTLAQGVLEYKRSKANDSQQANLQVFLDRFYMSRIGIRMLIGQHVALGRSYMAPSQGTLGYFVSGAATRPGHRDYLHQHDRRQCCPRGDRECAVRVRRALWPLPRAARAACVPQGPDVYVCAEPLEPHAV